MNLFPCTLVGSYAQPDWMMDKEKLKGRFPPRVRARELWRIPDEFLEEAKDDAVRLAVMDQELAGLDIIGDGEARRESYSNHFSNALDGIDLDNPGQALDRSGEPVYVPRIAGPIRRSRPVNVADVAFLKAHTKKPIKITVPGPFTMSQQAQNDYYPSPADAAMDYAAAVNAEMKDLFAAGADIVQLDEPYMQARADQAREYGVEAFNRALEGVGGRTCVHICFGYAALIHDRPESYHFLPELASTPVNMVSIETAQSNLDCKILERLSNKTILLGALDLSSNEVESVEIVKERVKRALNYCDKERIILAPDCGLKYTRRPIAFGKLGAMAQAAKELRAEFGG
ncbi:MAG: 5-methyltetrahydropteroyltriglutamate--homocysteine methyltransferase [Gammaproteobacteria bacterium]|nr:5-methyltetrahydropteroyltriglutamate--homocysteine methyltransferase [Gammaproteobacteria bacterium]